jgi:hypothetical protein
MIDADASPVSWSDDHDAYTTRFDDSCSPSVAVAQTLETALDGWNTPLFDYVDPDALDSLVADASESVTVTFVVEGAAVTVHGDGRVFVRL